MKKYLLIGMFLSLELTLCADSGRWTPIRPTILPVVKGGDLADVTVRPEVMAAVVESATRLLTTSGDVVLPHEIESIVLIERDADWLVVFFQKGNGRISMEVGDEPHYTTMIHLNPQVICVSKDGLSATRSSGYFALPWPVAVVPKLQVRYEDETPAERAERDGRSNLQEANEAEPKSSATQVRRTEVPDP